MAVDEALARCRRPGEATLRIYRWERPTLSFGRNQPARERYDPFALESLGVDSVRRPTGGREVLHDRELTYAVVAPVAGPGSLRGWYHEVNRALLETLVALGASGALAEPEGRALPPDAGACFGEPAEGEVVARGRKIVGSAQRRFGETLLQHGSLLLDRPSVSLEALRTPGGGRGEAGGITLAELLGAAPGFDRVAATVEAAFAGRFGGSWSRGDSLRPEEERLVRGLHPGYRDPERSWGR
jgi:lipoyl(octanoyl) transferase